MMLSETGCFETATRRRACASLLRDAHAIVVSNRNCVRMASWDNKWCAHMLQLLKKSIRLAVVLAPPPRAIFFRKSSRERVTKWNKATRCTLAKRCGRRHPGTAGHGSFEGYGSFLQWSGRVWRIGMRCSLTACASPLQDPQDKLYRCAYIISWHAKSATQTLMNEPCSLVEHISQVLRCS